MKSEEHADIGQFNCFVQSREAIRAAFHSETTSNNYNFGLRSGQ